MLTAVKEFLPRDATQNAVCLLRQGVCLSVSLSVTLRYRGILRK